MRALIRKIRKLLKDKRFRKSWYRGVSSVAAIVVFITTYALVLPAITMESEASCGIPAHQHSSECYEERLICGKEESDGHHHTDDCYTTTRELTCELPEHEHDKSCYDEEGNLTCKLSEHAHEDGCYEEHKELTCTLQESDGHHHDSSCYEQVLTCNLEAHIHSTECYKEESLAVAASTSATASTAATTHTGEEIFNDSTDEVNDASLSDSDGAASEKTELSGTASNQDAEPEKSLDTSDPAGTDMTNGSDHNTETNNSEDTDTENADKAEPTDSAETTDAATAATTGVLPEPVEQEELSDGYVPTLDPINLEQVLDKHTGFYYYHADETTDSIDGKASETLESSADITAWKKVNDDTKLAPTDLIKAYFAYTIPAGRLNETNQVARYRLPSNIHLTDDQIIAINQAVNGVATAYVDQDTLQVTDADNYNKYLGAEAVEGTRTPDETLVEGTQEYISAVVKAENVFENTLDKDGNYIDANGNIADGPGEYLGQDLIFIFTPYTIEKNQITYDTKGNPTASGEKVTGWFSCDFNVDQIDWVEAEYDADLDNSTTEKTAGIVFMSENKDLNIKEVSQTLTLVEINPDAGENSAEDFENAGEALTTDSSDQNDQSDSDRIREEDTEANTKENPDTDLEKEENKEEEKKEDTQSDEKKDEVQETSRMPAVTFDDSIRVRGAELSSDTASLDALTGKTTIKVHVEADEGTFPEGTTMALAAVTGDDLNTVKEAVQNAVDGSTRGFHAVDISFHDADGNEIEPLKPIRVSMQSDEIRKAVEDDSTAPVVMHVENKTNEASAVESNLASGTDGEEKNTDGQDDTLTFEADSFSVYAVVYTVDYHWEVDGQTYTLSVKGGSVTSFAKLIEAFNLLGSNGVSAPQSEIQEFIKNIESIQFSDESLVKAARIDEDTTAGQLLEKLALEPVYSADADVKALQAEELTAPDWALISLKPFDSEEELVITMKDGQVLTLHVTDAQITQLSSIDPNKEYIIYAPHWWNDSNDLDILKADGTTDHTKTAAQLSTLGSDYKWKIYHQYSGPTDSTGYYVIRPVNDAVKSLTLNGNYDYVPVQNGTSYVLMFEYENGFLMQSYSPVNDYGGYAYLMPNDNQDFISHEIDNDHPYVVRFELYDTSDALNYQFNVVSNDYSRGSVSGKDTTGADTSDQAQYESITSYDGTNKYAITATPKTGRYKFDHWTLNGNTISKDKNGNDLTATIPANAISIPSSGSTLEAHFVIDENYIVPDEEKEGHVVDKATLNKWLESLKNRQVPLDPNSVNKTAEVYDYENRIYRVDLTAKSSLVTFNGTVDLGLIMDASGSMQFPAKLAPVYNETSLTTPKTIVVNNLNNNPSLLNTNQQYYVIADKTGTATVFKIYWHTGEVWVQHGNNWYKENKTGWWAVDSSYSDNDSRAKYLSSDTRLSNDSAGMSYLMYVDAPNTAAQASEYNGKGVYVRTPEADVTDVKDVTMGRRRMNFLTQSVTDTISELNGILNTISVAANGQADIAPNVRVAWNTFCAKILHTNHTFTSVSNPSAATPTEWDTNGGTDTPLALEDALAFNWDTSHKNYAILITDGAPQRKGVAIPSSEVKAAADALKAKGVTLITVGLSMGDVKRGSVLLYDIADKDASGEPYFYKAEHADDLQSVLYEIIRRIAHDATVVGTVEDTISDAFYAIDLKTGERLKNGDVIDLNGNRVAAGAEGACGTVHIDSNGTAKITWTDNDITADGWKGTVYVKAKEDLLGGNGVATNKDNTKVEASQYRIDTVASDGTVTKGTPVNLKADVVNNDKYTKKIQNIPTPLVNVNELTITNRSTDWTVYLGTEVDPKKEIKNLYEGIEVKQVVTADNTVSEDGDNIIGYYDQSKELDERITNRANDTIPENQVFYPEKYVYPMMEATGDKREPESVSRTNASFKLMDLIPKLKEQGTNTQYATTDALINELIQRMGSGTTGSITFDYDAYGLDTPVYRQVAERDSDGNIVKELGADGSMLIESTPVVTDDKSTVKITLTKNVLVGTEKPISDSPHATTEVGKPVEQYTLTVEYMPDYRRTTNGNAENHIEGLLTDEDLIWHRGNTSTTYMGSPAGSETRDNVHTINVYAIPLDVLKLDDLGRTIQGAVFTLYKSGGDGAQTVEAIGDNESYSVVASGVSDADGVVHLIAGTKESYLEAGVEYTLVETSVPEGYLRDESVRKVKVFVQDDGTYTAVDVAKLQDGNFGQVTGDTLTSQQLTRPYNWDQGAYLTVDGKEAEIIHGSAAQTTAQQTGNSTGEAQTETNSDKNGETPTIAFHHGGNLAYRTTVENKTNYVKLDVTKKWEGGDGAASDKIKNRDTITFKVKREYTDAQGTKHTEDVQLSSGNIEIESGNTNITLADNQITLKYNNGWPTAHLVKLLCYAENNVNLKYTYFVEETARSTDDRITLASGYPQYNYARSENAKVDPDQATIINREQANIVINVKKEWLDGGGKTIEGKDAPESAITFDVYRRATVPHEHVWDEPKDYVPATCTTAGHYTHTCLACGAIETVTIPAKEHHFEESDWQIVRTYPKEDGLRYAEMERYCRNDCHEEGWHQTKEVRYACEDGAHQFTKEVVDQKPGCESTGTGHYVCVTCGERKTNEDGTNESHTIPATGHDYDLTTFTWKDGNAPNCTEGGTRVYKCNNNCGIDKEEAVEPLGHDMVENGHKKEGCEFFDFDGDGYDDFSHLTREDHTTANTGNIHYECSREGCDHTEDKAIPPHAHKWEIDLSQSHDATTTETGLQVFVCDHDSSHTYSQIIPKTAETFKGIDAETGVEIDTGLVVEPFEWPNKYKKDTDGNYLTDENGNYIEYTQEEKNTEKFKFSNKTSIIKCVLDPNRPDDVTYGIIYNAPLEKPLNDFLSGPGAGNVNNDTLMLTKQIWTSDTKPMNNKAIPSMDRGSLYGVKNGDGTYTWYAVLKSAVANTNGSYENLHKQASDIFYKLPPDSETLNGLSMSPTSKTTFKTAGLRRMGAKAALGLRGAGNDSETTDTNTGAKLTDAQKSDIATFLDMSVDNIKSRYESNEHNGYDAPVEVFEFVETVTLQKGDGSWHWASSGSANADKYIVSDEKGNTYTYFAIEKAPSSGYDTTYAYSGVAQKLKDKETETITNKQKNGSVKVTKEFSGIESLPDGFKITAVYTVEDIEHTVELTTTSVGVTGNGTSNDPYTWTIDGIPIGTEVTFKESGYNAEGYNTTVTGSATATDKTTASAVAAAIPVAASFVNTYTPKITVDILKIEKDRPDVKIPGAGFTLREVNEEITGNAPSYKNQDDQGDEKTTVDGGTTAFNNLSFGYYEIRETGIPAGYVVTGDDKCYIHVTASGAQMVKVNASHNGWEETNSYGNFEFDAASGSVNAKVTISNEPGAELPSAGGPGTRFIYLLGGMLTAFAVLVLGRRKLRM